MAGPRAGAALLGVCAAVAGCGGSSGSGASGSASGNSRPTGEAGAVHDAVVKFETSPDCDGITDAALKKFAEIGETRKQRCQIARNRNYPDASVVKVRAIKVTGATATAEVPAEAGGVKLTQGGKELVETVSLVKRGGRWLISDARTN
jgi:hypothetical protein